MIRRPPRSTQSRSSAASDVYKRQVFTILINNIVNGAFVIFKKDLGIKNIITNKHLICYLGNKIDSIFSDNDNIINIRAIGDEFIFFQTGPDKPLFIIYIEFC